MKTIIATLVSASLFIPAQVFAYEAGDWLVRGRIIDVAPNDSSGSLTVNGGDSGQRGVSVNSDTVPELDITYMLTPNWGLELILGYSQHKVRGEKTWAGLGDVINTKVLPPTLTLQYHFRPQSTWRPYVGLGVNYTTFFDEKVPSSSALSAAGDSVSLDHSWGLAAQAGIDVALNQDWFVNLDLKYIDIDTTAHFSGTAVGTAEIDADIDPWVWGVGVGRRF